MHYELTITAIMTPCSLSDKTYQICRNRAGAIAQGWGPNPYPPAAKRRPLVFRRLAFVLSTKPNGARKPIITHADSNRGSIAIIRLCLCICVFVYICPHDNSKAKRSHACCYWYLKAKCLLHRF